MKKILVLTLSLLMVFSVIPMAFVSAEETYSYKTIIDASSYDGENLGSYASPWYTAGLTRAYNTTYVGYDSTLDAMEIKRGAYDPAGLYYFDSTLGATAANSLGFRVWMKGGTDADTTSTKNLYFIFDTIDGETHTAYAAAWYTNSSYGVTVPADGGWVEFLWADMDKNFRVNTKNAFIPNASNKGGDRPTLSVGSGSAVKSENWLSKMDGFAIGLMTVKTNAIYYVGDVQFIMPASAEEPTSPSETDGLTTDAIATQDSASIRINEVSGMRFYTTVDTTALADLGEVTERGTLIGPADKVGTYLTIEDTEIPEGETVGNAVAVKYDLDKDLWENDEMVGSLVGIQEKNYTRNFVARAYVVVDGVYYYSKTTATKNVADIADAYLATNPKLDEVTSALVNSWAAAND